jgi:F-type H+-transporting ATPase subunit epsilon
MSHEHPAASSAKTVRVSVITPARTVLSAQAASVVVPAFDGEWAVFPGHADFMALLGCGRLTVALPDGDRRRAAVRGGFLQVKHDVVTVLTPESVTPDELDAAALHAELRVLTSERPAEAQRESHAEKLSWARARQKLLDAP